ncbi:hypothetical protein P7K49_027567 [Saguinus oedipus]|uniref:Uncharacterized protein n=1 Tax=Saguinus oedipus TaxID=9490 RepID=A0ABQ9U9U1_SAGOE|nr:hypothetical protein P7K49_027567 [Saguinus oedipus]
MGFEAEGSIRNGLQHWVSDSSGFDGLAQSAENIIRAIRTKSWSCEGRRDSWELLTPSKALL